MSYAFSFDASACSGCKACQAACKDKNNLPVGVLWRRVMEVSGGEWLKAGTSWNNTVFAYNLSMACNHCVHPKCAGVCPTNAYQVRADGIVVLDSSKCVGCGYCNWACPYAVPQYNPEAGVMGKCDFCCEKLDAGQAPVCVAACPLRVLDYLALDEQKGDLPGLALWEMPGSGHPFPLPSFSRTQPHLLIKPHAGMLSLQEKNLANREEIKPQRPKSEVPLVFFSLLTQMAVGAFWVSQWLFRPFAGLIQAKPSGLDLLPFFMVGLSLGLALLVSFGHLGRKRNAWRMFSNLRKSWLSREVLGLGLFGAGWLGYGLFPSAGLGALTCLLGFWVVYGMANVYMLRSMAVWNRWRTLAGFLCSAVLLGLFYLLPVWMLDAQRAGAVLPDGVVFRINSLGLLLLAGELGLMYGGASRLGWVGRLRVGVLVVGLLGLISGLSVPGLSGLPFAVVLFILLWIEELLGRWSFYSELDRRRL